MYGAVPADGVKSIEPVDAPLQSTFVKTLDAIRLHPEHPSATFARLVVEQPFASVTVTLYAPGFIFGLLAVVTPFDQTNEYAPVPPEAVTVAEPLFGIQVAPTVLFDADKAVAG